MEPVLIALGVNGGPRLSPGHPKPALALNIDSSIYLVDCGYETALQFVAAGLPFSQLRQVFLTHNHLDHTSGIPSLFIHGWVAPQPLRAEIGIWGPKPTDRFVSGLTAMFGTDIQNYEAGGGFGKFPMPESHDIEVSDAESTLVYGDENVTVTAAKVFHGAELAESFALRFDLKASGKSIVFSGDVGPMDANLISLAKGCNYLVHEVQDNAAVEKLVASIPDPTRAAELREHMLTSHTSIEDLPHVAAAAGAEALILCHYTPFPQAAEVFKAKVQTQAELAGYSGQIIAPSALERITL